MSDTLLSYFCQLFYYRHLSPVIIQYNIYMLKSEGFPEKEMLFYNRLYRTRSSTTVDCITALNHGLIILEAISYILSHNNWKGSLDNGCGINLLNYCTSMLINSAKTGPPWIIDYFTYLIKGMRHSVISHFTTNLTFYLLKYLNLYI